MSEEAELLFDELETFLSNIEDHKSPYVRKYLEKKTNNAFIQLLRLKELFQENDLLKDKVIIILQNIAALERMVFYNE